MRTVGGVWSVDQWCELGQINLNDLVILCAIIGAKVRGNFVGSCSNCFASCCTQVVTHVAVVTKHRTRGANFCTHVADGCLARCRDAVSAWSEVFSDGPSATFHGELTSNFQDDVFRAAPTGQCAGELDADDFWPTNVEWETCHDVNGIGATNSDSNHAESTSVWCVAVGTDHHAARECVVLEHNLVNDSAAWAPEANTKLCAHAAEEVVYLAVDIVCVFEVELCADLGQDEVVTMHC